MKSIFRSTIFVFGAIAVIGIWFAVNWRGQELKLSVDSLNALFTGLGFVGILATLAHERGEAAARDKEHMQLIATMQAQNRATCHAAQITGKAALLEHYRDQYASYNPVGVTGVVGDKVQRMRTELQQKILHTAASLEKAIETGQFV